MKRAAGDALSVMQIHRLLAVLAAATTAAAMTTGTEKQLPVHFIPMPLPGPEYRRLRGMPGPEYRPGVLEALDGPLPVSMAGLEPLAFGAARMGAMPLEIPEAIELARAHPGEAVEVGEGSLRDLLDFGGAMGAAVLGPRGLQPITMSSRQGAGGLESFLKALSAEPRPEVQPITMSSRQGAGGLESFLKALAAEQGPEGAEPLEMSAQRGLEGIGGQRGGPLELPLGALHVKLREHVPKPLQVEDGNGKVRIYGTLPKKLTAKTLKVSVSGSDGRSLRIQYFLGQDAGNAVGIDEHFALDFAPAGTPAVSYKAATGAFELVLTRPVVTPRTQVTINFDSSPPTNMSAMVPGKIHAVTAVPNQASTVKVALKRKAPAAHQRSQHTQASPGEFAHESKMKRMSASPAPKQTQASEVDLAKVTKALHQVVQTGGVGSDQEKAARVRDISDRVKRFVADAHLTDAQKELKTAFEPLDLGLVMLEMNHRVKAH